MSHITKVKTKLKDIKVLKEALSDVGYEVAEKTHYRGREVEIFACKKQTRLGFYKNQERGEYVVFADSEEVSGTLKKLLNPIFQAYSRRKILKMANEKGYYVVRENMLPGGRLEIVLRAMF